MLRHAGCGFLAIEEYIARRAGDLLGIQKPAAASGPIKQSQQSLAIGTDSPSGRMTSGSQHLEDHEGLDLLEDIDGETMSHSVNLSTIRT